MIDELLKVFVGFAVSEWPEDFVNEWPRDSAGAAAQVPRRTCAISAGGASWLVRTGPGQFNVTGGPGMAVARDSAPDVAVQGPPAALLRWVWNRELPDAPGGLTIEGDRDALTDFRQYVVIATQ